MMMNIQDEYNEARCAEYLNPLSGGAAMAQQMKTRQADTVNLGIISKQLEDCLAEIAHITGMAGGIADRVLGAVAEKPMPSGPMQDDTSIAGTVRNIRSQITLARMHLNRLNG